MSFKLRLRTMTQVRVFAACVTLLVVGLSNLASYLLMPFDIFSQTRVISIFISVSLGAVISFVVGLQMHRVESLTRQLQHLVNRDQLTGLRTRARFFEKSVDRSLYPAAIVMADIDHFKSVNDRFGHVAGDMALVRFAEALSRNCRESDLVARFGGEEFVLLLPRMDAIQGAMVAERLRDRVSRMTLHAGDSDLVLTASFGVAALSLPEELDRAIHEADLALYQSKNAGRNRVTLFGMPNEDEPMAPDINPVPEVTNRRRAS